jgi:curved DNA-binding protein CbpA
MAQDPGNAVQPLSAAVNHYDLLEVSPKASAEVIRAAYKSLMQRHHPDKNDNGAAATAQTALLAQAYAVLSDAQRRLAYDESLAPLPEAARHSASAAQRSMPTAAVPARNGYAPALILVILLAGGAILWLSPGKEPGTAAPQERREPAARPAGKGAELATGALPAAGGGDPVAAAVDGSSRTVAAFMTELSVDLTASDPLVVHVLQIPEFGLRLSVREPDRWLHSLQAQRPQLTRQLLAALSKANYLELVKADGDLYLRKLMEEALLAALGPEQAGFLPAAAPSPTAPPPLQVLLPLSYTVR